MKIFIDCDTQVDFCAKKGALFVPGAEKLYDIWEDLVNYARKKEHLILGSVDSHTYDSWEFKTNSYLGPNGQKPNFPRHCVKGTQGWLKILETFVMNSVFVPANANDISYLYGKKDLEAIYFEKEVYSLLSNILSERFFAYTHTVLPDTLIEYYVFGVATDYCVYETCVDMAQMLKKPFVSSDVSYNGKVFLIEDAIVGIDKEKSAQCIENLKRLGVVTTTSQEVMKIA